MPRRIYSEEILASAMPVDLTVNPYIAGDSQLPADWIELPAGGTLTYLDGSGNSQTVTNAQAGYVQSVPGGFRKVVSLTGASTMRVGTGTGPRAPSAGSVAWLSANGFAKVTGTAYVAEAGELVLVNTAAATTVTLPSAVGLAGQRIRVQDSGAGAATHNITIATTSAQTIQGTTPAPIATNGAGQTYVSDGANWYYG